MIALHYSQLEQPPNVQQCAQLTSYTSQTDPFILYSSIEYSQSIPYLLVAQSPLLLQH
jgi:hypothetical protein